MPEADPKSPALADVLARLGKIEGQVRGVARMLESGRDCEAVLTQILAVRAALDRTAAAVSSGYVSECLRGDPPEVAEQRLSRIVTLLARTG